MKQNNNIRTFCVCLVNPKMMGTAIRVSLMVGSILFMINHGSALLKGEMNPERWISAGITYLIPYMVNIHGQFINDYRK